MCGFRVLRFSLTIHLHSSQLTINTAIVYMHRFYMHHSFTKFHRNVSMLSCISVVNSFVCVKINFVVFTVQIISPTTLFLAAKVEEQPRKLEHVIKVAHACLNPQESPLDTKSNVSSRYSECDCRLHLTLQFSCGFPINLPGCVHILRSPLKGPKLTALCLTQQGSC